MPVRKSIHEKDGVFFITITCARWIKFYEMVNGYDIVYHWFDHLKSRGHYIIGYVIMPNHLHALIGFKNTGKSILILRRVSRERMREWGLCGKSNPGLSKKFSIFIIDASPQVHT